MLLRLTTHSIELNLWQGEGGNMASPTQFKVYCTKRDAAGRSRKMLAQFADHTDAVNWAIDASSSKFRFRQGDAYTLTVEYGGKVIHRLQNGNIDNRTRVS